MDLSRKVAIVTGSARGIGLAIAKKIIDKHNGMITATSHEGDGTQFKIILPLKQTIY